jgi:hypothetical protein
MIITGRDVLPEWTSSDLFISHAANATGITWGIECHGCRIEDIKSTFVLRTASSRDILWVVGIIQEELKEQKVLIRCCR